MTKILDITATTDTASIEAAIPYLDMRAAALEARDMAAAVIPEQGDQVVLELHEVDDDILVLYSPTFGYAYVNRVGVGDSLLIDNGEALSPEDAASRYIGSKEG